MTLKLTFPRRSHSVDDLVPLYEEFKTEYPDLFNAWKQIEMRGDIGPDDLKSIQYEIYDFLKSKTEWESHAAVGSAFSDFRGLLARERFR